MAVAILFAIGLIMAGFMGDEVRQREAIMGGEKIDGATDLAAREDVGGSRKPGREHTDGAGIAAPETPHIVTVAVVPFQPGRGKAAELIAAGADIPRLGDQDAIGEQGVGGDLAEQGGLGIEAYAGSPHNRCEIETKSVDPGG